MVSWNSSTTRSAGKSRKNSLSSICSVQLMKARRPSQTASKPTTLSVSMMLVMAVSASA